MFCAVSPRATFAVTKRPVLPWLRMVEFYFLLMMGSSHPLSLGSSLGSLGSKASGWRKHL